MEEAHAEDPVQAQENGDQGYIEQEAGYEYELEEEFGNAPRDGELDLVRRDDDNMLNEVQRKSITSSYGVVSSRPKIKITRKSYQEMKAEREAKQLQEAEELRIREEREKLEREERERQEEERRVLEAKEAAERAQAPVPKPRPVPAERRPSLVEPGQKPVPAPRRNSVASMSTTTTQAEPVAMQPFAESPALEAGASFSAEPQHPAPPAPTYPTKTSQQHEVDTQVKALEDTVADLQSKIKEYIAQGHQSAASLLQGEVDKLLRLIRQIRDPESAMDEDGAASETSETSETSEDQDPNSFSHSAEGAQGAHPPASGDNSSLGKNNLQDVSAEEKAKQEESEKQDELSAEEKAKQVLPEKKELTPEEKAKQEIFEKAMAAIKKAQEQHEDAVRASLLARMEAEVLESKAQKLKKKEKYNDKQLKAVLGRVNNESKIFAIGRGYKSLKAKDKKFLSFDMNDELTILSIEDTPPGLWVCRNKTGAVGFVKTHDLTIDAEYVNQRMKIDPLGTGTSNVDPSSTATTATATTTTTTQAASASSPSIAPTSALPSASEKLEGDVYSSSESEDS